MSRGVSEKWQVRHLSDFGGEVAPSEVTNFFKTEMLKNRCGLTFILWEDYERWNELVRQKFEYSYMLLEDFFQSQSCIRRVLSKELNSGNFVLRPRGASAIDLDYVLFRSDPQGDIYRVVQ